MNTSRDPRIDPWPGDILDDDPPAPPLVVWQHRDRPRFVGAARYTRVEGHDDSCECPGCRCTFSGAWPIEDWRKDMADAVVLHVEPELRLLDELALARGRAADQRSAMDSRELPR